MDELKKRFQVAQWIAEDFAGTIGEAHRAALHAWRKEAARHEEEYQELREELRRSSWLMTDAEKDLEEQQWLVFQKRRFRSYRKIWKWGRYAAMVVFMVGLAVFIRPRIGQEDRRPQIAGNEIRQASGEVMLVLSSGKTMTLKDSSGILQEEPFAEIQVKGRTISYREEQTDRKEEIYNTLIVPRGGEYKIELADGTRVWLNAGTEFRYPVRFAGTDRRVYLQGEAYFEVAPDRNRPFWVITEETVEVKVLGTHFNLSAYTDDAEVVTTLAEGCVEVHTPTVIQQIHPDEQSIFHKQLRSLRNRKVDARVYTAWKEGKFVFEEQTLEQIMKQLQRWYEMEVFYTNDELKNYRFSGDLKKYEDFGQIVKMIEEVAGLRMTVKDKCVVIGMKE